MTEKQSIQPNINELGAKFGEDLAQAYGQIITLQKQLTGQAFVIQELTKNETVLVDHIQELEAELIELKKSLEMINDRGSEKSTISPTAQLIAQQGTEIIAATKKPSEEGQQVA